jgi:hypothetical protein
MKRLSDSHSAEHTLGSGSAGGRTAQEQPNGILRAIALLTPEERLAEIAEILATGLIRLLARQSSQKSAEIGEFPVDLAPDQSGPANGPERTGGLR